MTARQCSGITADGTRCRNRGRCPHHAGGRRTPRRDRIDPAILNVGQYDVYNPRAFRSKVKDTTPKPRWQAPPWAGTHGDQLEAQIDQLHRESAELSDALDVGWGEFFRTLFKRKR